MRKRKMMRRRVRRKPRKNIKKSKEKEGKYTCVTDGFTIHIVSYWPFSYNSSL